MKNKSTETLTKSQTSRFNELDKTITDGAITFLTVGRALVEMHKEKLYRRDFSTFEAYTESRGLKRRQAYTLMTAVQMSLELENVRHGAHDSDPINKGDVEKTSAKALEKLARAPKEKRAEIFSKAAKKSKGVPTAKAIVEVTAEVTHKPLPNPVLPAAAEPTGEHPSQKDIPDDIGKEKPAESVPVVLPEVAPAAEPTPVQEPSSKPKSLLMTPARFKIELEILEARINEICDGNQKEREKYGIIANAFTGRLMNSETKKPFNPYGA